MIGATKDFTSVNLVLINSIYTVDIKSDRSGEIISCDWREKVVQKDNIYYQKADSYKIYNSLNKKQQEEAVLFLNIFQN